MKKCYRLSISFFIIAIVYFNDERGCLNKLESLRDLVKDYRCLTIHVSRSSKRSSSVSSSTVMTDRLVDLSSANSMSNDSW